ncbi:MAG: NYN domain-containing protein [Clostridiaceae bacterium]|nr:NYN domain-containing protein [Clostridiaceae bacterium]
MENTKATTSDIRLAVLIDADNVPPHNVRGMMEEIARYGTPTIKRIYGDFTKPNLAQWKSQLLDYAISPIQQFSYTSGKNATDSAMIIDAMDILYTDKIDGFVLVSSDSDFTKLATRLRESGKTVYGFGEMKTPNAFIAACDRFIYLEIIDQHTEDEDQEKEKPEKETAAKPASRARASVKKETDKKEADKKPAAEKKQAGTRDAGGIRKVDRELIKLINSSIRDVEDENGWAFLAEVGNLIIKKQPSFDSRNYGYDKLTTLVRSMGRYEIEMRDTGNPNVKLVYLKIKAR